MCDEKVFFLPSFVSTKFICNQFTQWECVLSTTLSSQVCVRQSLCSACLGLPHSREVCDACPLLFSLWFEWPVDFAGGHVNTLTLYQSRGGDDWVTYFFTGLRLSPCHLIGVQEELELLSTVCPVYRMMLLTVSWPLTQVENGENEWHGSQRLSSSPPPLSLSRFYMRSWCTFNTDSLSSGTISAVVRVFYCRWKNTTEERKKYASLITHSEWHCTL